MTATATSRYRYTGGIDEVIVAIGGQGHQVARGRTVQVPAGTLDGHPEFEPVTDPAPKPARTRKED